MHAYMHKYTHAQLYLPAIIQRHALIPLWLLSVLAVSPSARDEETLTDSLLLYNYYIL